MSDAVFSIVAPSAEAQAVDMGRIAVGTQRDSLIQSFVRKCPVPLVLDADGLNALSEAPETVKGIEAPCILTPHPG